MNQFTVNILKDFIFILWIVRKSKIIRIIQKSQGLIISKCQLHLALKEYRERLQVVTFWKFLTRKDLFLKENDASKCWKYIINIIINKSFLTYIIFLIKWQVITIGLRQEQYVTFCCLTEQKRSINNN